MRTGLPLWLALAALAALAAVACSAQADSQGINLTWDDLEEKPLPVHGVALFNFTICVTGDGGRARLDVDLLGEPPGWHHTLSAHGTAGILSSNGTLNLTVPVDFVSNATLSVYTNGSAQMGTYPMVVRATSTLIEASDATHALVVDVPRDTDFETLPLDQGPSGSIGAYPLSHVTLRVAVYNKGNALDRFLVTGNASLSYDGWALHFVSGVNETGWTPLLPPDPLMAMPHFVEALVVVPDRVPAGVLCQIFLNATAESDPVMTEEPAHFMIRCLQYYDFSLELVSEGQVDAWPGDVVEFRFRVANLGNGADELLLDVVWDEHLCPGFIAAPNPRTLPVGAWGEGGFVCTIKVPDGAPIGMYGFNARVNSTAPMCSAVSRLMLVSIGQVRSIELAFCSSSASAPPGGVVEFAGSVGNMGNGLDRIELSVRADHQEWPATVTPGWTELRAGEAVGVVMRVSVPSYFEGVPDDLSVFVVSAWSVVDGPSAEWRFEVRLEPFERVEWLQGRERVTGPSAPSVAIGGCVLNPYSQSVSWEAPGLELLSMGTVATNVTLDATTEAAGLDVALWPRWAALAPNSTRTVRLEVSVGLDAEPGPHEVLLSARAEGAPGAKRTLVVHVNVILVDLSMRRPISAEGPSMVLAPNGTVMARLGDDVRLLFTVENLGTVNVTDAAVHIMRHLPDGTVVVLNSYGIRLGVGRQQELSYTWHADAAGDGWFDVVLELPDQARKDNDGASILVSIEGPEGDDKGPAPYADARVLIEIVLILVVLAILVNESLSRRRGRPPRA